METLTPKKLLEERSQMAALATLNQRWAEYCKEISQKEMTVELRWLTRGMAVGFQLSAWRARCLAHPLSGTNPPEGDLGFVLAFETILKMAVSLTQGQGVAELKAEALDLELGGERVPDEEEPIASQ